MTSESYRPEIDGLRALAVMPVILYHLSPVLVQGGFLGVDVFFVISGYLITRLLVADLDRAQFSLWRFYERRARRILPALFVVIAACVLPAAAFMLPGQQADFGLAVLAAVGFVSNLLYYGSTGYFMASAEIKPLLHTWSLAVEEQFYLFFPLLLFVVWRYARTWLVAVLAAVGLASVGMAAWLAYSDPAAGFYLLPARAWELMAGALVAVVARRPGKALAETAAVAGLAMIALAYASPAGTTILGLPAPLAVAGTALFIWAGGGTLTARVVSTRPLRAIGLVSYSAYLWHWPLLAFWRLRGGAEMTPVLGVLLVALTLALATLTYFCVERPFRNHGATARFPTRALVPFLTSGAVALALFGLLPLMPGGGREASSVETRLGTNYGLSQACEGAFTLDPTCRTSDKPEILLWGDSYAMHLAPAIIASGDWGGMIQMTKSSCAPILGLSTAPEEYEATWFEGCLRFNDEVFAWLAGADTIRTVVLSSNLHILTNELRRPDGSTVPVEGAEAAVRIALLDTVKKIRALGKDVVMVSPTPTTGSDVGQCLAATDLAGTDSAACNFPLAEIAPVNRNAFGFLEGLAGHVPQVVLTDLICPEGICLARRGDIFIFRDTGHLAIEGAEWLGRTYRFDRLLRQAASGPAGQIN